MANATIARVIELLPSVLAETRMIWTVYVVGLLLERLRPADSRVQLPTLLHNMLLVPVYTLLITTLVTPMHTAVTPLLGWGWRPFEPPDHPVAKAAAVIAWLAVFDFFYYWFHRAMHAHPCLWRIHELHHSDPAVGVTTTVRLHWLEAPIRLIAITLPMGVLLEFDLPDLGRAGMLGFLWIFFIHLNLRFPLGPLTGWISGPQWHRLHHSREARHRGCNFALYFPAWDRLFGTYQAPARGEYPVTGVEGGVAIGWRDWLWPRRLRRAAPPPR